jgi:hypothetical protein
MSPTRERTSRSRSSTSHRISRLTLHAEVYRTSHEAHFPVRQLATASIEHRCQVVARYARCYEPGSWLPAPRLRPEPPVAAPPAELVVPEVCPPELPDYPELCA